MADTVLDKKPQRLVSLDAYRGFVMLAMASNGFAIHRVLTRNPEIVGRFDGSSFATVWEVSWRWLAHQLTHVPWTGCVFWDLIQPSFMFMVGVAMPFSFAKRQAQGQSPMRRFAHVLFRAAVLVALGVFLQSKRTEMTDFNYVNVLTQIGLGYAFVYLLLGRHYLIQLATVAVVLVGYWYFFFQYEMPAAEEANLTRYLQEVQHANESEWNQFSGLASHWNKHTNAAAGFDRWFMNLFPRPQEPWEGQRFWINGGGYQTLNFVPSIATMILGLMAGGLLLRWGDAEEALHRLLLAGAACFVIAIAIDTTIWPFAISDWKWSLCPAVKRIWTPSWTLFSSGWCFWMLAAFYWVIDIRGYKRWAFPLVVVGMNSIAMYVMAQLMQGWVGRMLETHLRTVDSVLGTEIVYRLFSSENPYAPIYAQTAILFVFWLICLWLYRQKIFVRI